VLVRISFRLLIIFYFSLSKDFQIRTLDIDSKICKLQVWDTAGQDRFKCIVTSFYRNANGVIICFDLTDFNSFRNVQTWYEEVKRYCPNQTPVILIGTKSDLSTNRMVSDEMIKTYIEQNQLSYLETSSKTNENVEKCFLDFTRTLISHIDQINMIQKNDQIGRSITNLNIQSKPIKNQDNTGCMGRNRCTI
jgi:Ras-related protein Rab-1A